MNTDRTEVIDTIRDVYENCQGNWTGCDWTTSHGATQLDLDGCDPDHLRAVADRMDDGTATDEDWDSIPQADSIEDMDLLPCDHDDQDVRRAISKRHRIWAEDLRSGADWLDECASAAASSEAYGAEAIEHIESGDLNEALDLAAKACNCESEYGDCPVWGALRNVIRRAIDADVSAPAE